MSANRIITMTTEIKPVVEHIQDLQIQLKALEAELKQYKSLLQNDYMKDALKLETAQGVVVASMIESKSVSLDKERFALEAPKEFKTYSAYIVEKIYSYLKVR